MRRVGGAIGVVIVREERNTKFGERIKGRIGWDFREEEEINGGHVVDGLFRCRGLESLHQWNGVIDGRRGRCGSVTGSHAMIVSVRGQHVMGSKTVNKLRRIKISCCKRGM